MDATERHYIMLNEGGGMQVADDTRAPADLPHALRGVGRQCAEQDNCFTLNGRFFARAADRRFWADVHAAKDRAEAERFAETEGRLAARAVAGHGSEAADAIEQLAELTLRLALRAHLVGPARIMSASLSSMMTALEEAAGGDRGSADHCRPQAKAALGRAWLRHNLALQNTQQSVQAIASAAVRGVA